MIPNGDLENFEITVYLAIVGQTLGILNLIYEQTKHDIFFLDWEKPRKVRVHSLSMQFRSIMWRMWICGFNWPNVGAFALHILIYP